MSVQLRGGPSQESKPAKRGKERERERRDGEIVDRQREEGEVW